MISRFKTVHVRSVVGVFTMVVALVLFQGCGKDANDHGDDADYDNTSVGNGDRTGSEVSHDGNEADEHDEHVEADEHEEAGEHDEADEHDEAGEHDEADEHDEHAEGDAHGEEVEFTEPRTYTEAIHVIHEQLEKINSLMGSGTLDRVHAEAAVIRDVANTLAKFALQDDSGIPRDAIREINLAARDLAATFDPIDKAGDSGDLAGTQKVYDEMLKLFETLEKYTDDDDHGGG